MDTVYFFLFVAKLLISTSLILSLSMLAGEYVVKKIILSRLGEKYLSLKLGALGILFGVFSAMDYLRNYNSIGEWRNAIIQNGMTQADYTNYGFLVLAIVCLAMAAMQSDQAHR